MVFIIKRNKLLVWACFGLIVKVSFSDCFRDVDEFNNKVLDINLNDESPEVQRIIRQCAEPLLNQSKHLSTGNYERQYMDYRHIYGLKFDPSTLRPTISGLDEKLDFPKPNVIEKLTGNSKLKKKKTSVKKKTKKKPKKKMQKIKLMKPPEYHEMVSPITVVQAKEYPSNVSRIAENITKLQKYQKLVASLRKKMKQLRNFTRNTTVIAAKSDTDSSPRFLDLLEVVEFQHRPFCFASPPPLARMMGSCYSHKQCRKLGGLSLSECAHGYGICCVFKMTCNGFTDQEISYFESPGYPAPSLTQLSCSMAIILKPKTQQLLLEFEFFELLPPTNGTCVADKFVVVGQNTNKPVPILCGINTGQHMYVDVFDAIDHKIFLTVIGNGNEARGFRIKVTQLIDKRAPADCLQFYEGVIGFVKSFNYDTMPRIVRKNVGNYFNNLNYAICIRRNPGYCTISYTTEETGSPARQFQLVNRGINGASTVPVGQAGAEIFNCPDDYISVNSIRLCGDKLNDASVTDNFTLNAPITDFSFGPIVIPVRTNSDTVGRGFNLFYTQKPCKKM